MKHEYYDKWFTPAAAIQSEGARIGLCNCRVCGACILLDSRDEINYARKHAEWHEFNSVLQRERGEQP